VGAAVNAFMPNRYSNGRWERVIFGSSNATSPIDRPLKGMTRRLPGSKVVSPPTRRQLKEQRALRRLHRGAVALVATLALVGGVTVWRAIAGSELEEALSACTVQAAQHEWTTAEASCVRALVLDPSNRRSRAALEQTRAALQRIESARASRLR
jgi:hypothetical protein